MQQAARLVDYAVEQRNHKWKEKHSRSMTGKDERKEDKRNESVQAFLTLFRHLPCQTNALAALAGLPHIKKKS